MSNVNKYIELDTKLKELVEKLDNKKEQFNIENQDLIDSIGSLKTDLAMKKEDIELDYKIVFNESGIKKFDSGCSIRETKKLIYDSKDAFNWAKEKQLALKLDETAFKKIYKSGSTDVDFVKEETEIKVCFPTAGLKEVEE